MVLGRGGSVFLIVASPHVRHTAFHTMMLRKSWIKCNWLNSLWDTSPQQPIPLPFWVTVFSSWQYKEHLTLAAFVSLTATPQFKVICPFAGAKQLGKWAQLETFSNGAAFYYAKPAGLPVWPQPSWLSVIVPQSHRGTQELSKVRANQRELCIPCFVRAQDSLEKQDSSCQQLTTSLLKKSENKQNKTPHRKQTNHHPYPKTKLKNPNIGQTKNKHSKPKQQKWGCREIWKDLWKSFGGRMPGTEFLSFWWNLNWRKSKEKKHSLRGTKKYISYESHQLGSW